MGAGALDGVVVLDLTQVLAGPYCTMLLADHGADVIKVEPPHGDLSRSLGAFFPEDVAKAESGYFHSINRNKRSMVLDLKSVTGRDTFLALVARADVVVENFRVGVMDRLGLSFETLREHNPRLVYAAISGFGDPRTGRSPYAAWPAFDVVAQAMGGFMGVTGPGTPMKSGPGVGDIFPGVLLAFGVLAALRHAEKTGEGQFVDVAMYDAMVALCERIVQQYSVGGVVPRPEGNNHPLAAPFSIFTARDGWVAIACPFEDQWRTLTQIIQRPELAEDERYASNLSRAQHPSDIRALLDAWCVQFTKSELAGLLGGRVPFGPVNDVAEILADPHMEARDMIAEIELPAIERVMKIANTPIRLSSTPGGVEVRGPRLGEHTADVLREFGVHEDAD